MFKEIICHPRVQGDKGYILEYEFYYPEDTHQRNNDLTAGPEKMKVRLFLLSVMLIMKEKYLLIN